jgi:hypothetical protein
MTSSAGLIGMHMLWLICAFFILQLHILYVSKKLRARCQTSIKYCFIEVCSQITETGYFEMIIYGRKRLTIFCWHTFNRSDVGVLDICRQLILHRMTFMLSRKEKTEIKVKWSPARLLICVCFFVCVLCVRTLFYLKATRVGTILDKIKVNCLISDKPK